jgi:hypothetical protein
MMEKPAIYVETSVLSYLVARRSRDLIVAAHQQVTVEWWRTQKPSYDLFTSQIVIEEAGAGDPDTAEKRLAAVEDLPLLEVNEEAIHLAQELITSHAVPEKAARDALHIAVACVGRCGLPAHLELQAHRERKGPKLDREDLSKCHTAPIMCTPEELED